jgi:regulator of sigma E protease
MIHELGHFLLAKKNKINVEEFGFGYPPKLLKLFEWKGTAFTLNAIPFGGFVRLEGEDGPKQEEKKEKQLKKKLSKKQLLIKKNGSAFYEKSKKQRIAVILAGPIINFLYGVLAFSIIFSFIGIPVFLEGQARIEQVMPDTPAAQANLPTNVNIKAIKFGDEFHSINNITEAAEVIDKYRGNRVTLVTSGPCYELSCEDANQEFDVYLRTIEETPEGQGSMGIVFAEAYFKFYPILERPFRGIFYGLTEAVMMGAMIIMFLSKMLLDIFLGAGIPQDIAGPVGIVHQAHKVDLAASGWVSILTFSAMLSINLAIMNLLPIPALDGGRALFIFLEKMLGKKRIEKIENFANYGGFALLFALLILVTIKDIWGIFNG